MTVGAGVGWTPKYPGADSYRLRALPVIGVSYGRFFAGGDSGGGAGGGARREPARPSRGVLFGGYNWSWLSVQLRITPDIGGNDQGTLAFLDVTARYRATERLVFSAGPGVTWADDGYMMTFFGVSADQAARSALPAYDARGGVHALRFGINVACRIGQPWTVGGKLAARRTQCS